MNNHNDSKTISQDNDDKNIKAKDILGSPKNNLKHNQSNSSTDSPGRNNSFSKYL
jgi:hypothetical protein